MAPEWPEAQYGHRAILAGSGLQGLGKRALKPTDGVAGAHTLAPYRGELSPIALLRTP